MLGPLYVCVLLKEALEVLCVCVRELSGLWQTCCNVCFSLCVIQSSQLRSQDGGGLCEPQNEAFIRKLRKEINDF